jgi:hypothetical protein
MANRLIFGFLALLLMGFARPEWGFFGHRQINRLAVFTLPVEMAGFYKKNLDYLEAASVNPDRRRYSVPEEGPRHYIDLDGYGDSAVWKLPRYAAEANKQLGADSLLAHGSLPWHLFAMYARLRDAFLVGDPDAILRLSAELGHYVADAHVPLHTTSNYDGQQTKQPGIHALWESRLPELFFGGYQFWVGRATYVERVQLRAWDIVVHTNSLVDSVLTLDQQLQRTWGEAKFSFETKGKQTQRVVSQGYARAYHDALQGMVERQMQASVKALGDFWYTAWVDGGQPDLRKLMNYEPTAEELRQRAAELALWKAKRFGARGHEVD